MPDPAGGLVGAACALAAAPYVARLARGAPDRDDHRWWRWSRSVPRQEIALAAAIGTVLGALAGAAVGLGAALAPSIALALVTAALTVVDVRTHRLPDRLVVPAGIAAAASAAFDPASLPRTLAGAAAVFVALGLLAAPGWLGFGDVKLGAVLGGYLARFGWTAVVDGVAAGFLLGALVAGVLVAARWTTASSTIPFGPMLVLGALMVPAFGP